MHVKRIAPTLVALMLFSVPNAFSQPADNGTRQNTYHLGDITVTATRYEKDVYETAVPTSVIDREAIEDRAPRSMGDLLSSIPGVYAAEDGALSTGKPVIRGFYGSRVQVLIDGQRLQSSLGGIWGGPEVSLVDPDLLERVEVVYGPASSLYGSDAIGGTINLITRRAQLSDTPYRSCSLSTYYTSNGKGNRETLRAETGSRTWAVGLSATNRQSNDYHAPDGKMQNSGMKMRSGGLDITLMPAKNHTLVITAQANRNRDLERPPSVSPVAVTEIETSDYNRRKLGIDYTWSDITRHISALTLKAYYQKDDADFTFHGDIRPVLFLAVDTFSRGDSELETFGLQGQVNAGLHSAIRTVAGFDYYYNSSGPNRTDSRTLTRIFDMARPAEYSTDIAEDGKADSLGIFMHNEFFISLRLAVTFGIRYDWYRSRISYHGDDPSAGKRSGSDSALTGSLAISYEFFKGLRWYANLARGFRAPTLRDLYYRGPVPGGLLSKGNPALDPETCLTVTTGFKVKSKRITGALNIFRSDVDDLILSVNQHEAGDPAGGSVSKDNLGEARLWGVEVWFSSMVSESLTYDLAFTYTQGKDMTNRWPLQAIPPARLKQSLRWQREGILFAGKPLWGEIVCTYRFHQNRIARDWDTQRMKTPGHARWDFRCGAHLPSLFADETLELYLALTNITDKRYTEFPLYDGYDLLTMPGIGATMGLRIRF